MQTREMQKLRRKFNNTIIKGLFILFVLFLAVRAANQPYFHVKEETITRNLGWMILPMETVPSNRMVAWDSELPSFVEKDLAYAEKHGYDVEYEFKGNIMRLEYKEGEWELRLRTRIDSGSEWDSLKNFSMYQTRDHKIVLYGYTFFGEWFQKITLEKNKSRIDTITYDANLPLDEYNGAESIGAIHINGYSVVEASGNFFFYKDGYYVGYQSFPHGEIKQKDLYKGMILTTNNKLYTMYVSNSDSMPEITFTYVDTADGIVKTEYYYDELSSMEDDKEYLSMVRKNDRIYVAIPEDWETFDKYALARFNNELHWPATQFNYALQLVDLEKSLKEVCFHSTTSQWYATIVFNFNGREFYTDYFFDGYDDSIRLPEETKALFEEKRVTTFDEMWENIEAIRTTYFDYYEHRGDFVPAVIFGIKIVVLFAT